MGSVVLQSCIWVHEKDSEIAWHRQMQLKKKKNVSYTIITGRKKNRCQIHCPTVLPMLKIPADEGRSWNCIASCSHQCSPRCRQLSPGKALGYQPGWHTAEGHPSCTFCQTATSEAEVYLRGLLSLAPVKHFPAAHPQRRSGWTKRQQWVSGSISHSTNSYAILRLWLGHKRDNCLTEGLLLGARYGLSFP